MAELRAHPGEVPLDVLIPTCDRHAALAVTLTSLQAQDFSSFRVMISDQGDDPAEAADEVRAVVRVLEAHGNPVRFFRNLPRRGMAQQRGFLLDLGVSQFSLFLDDDLILEPWVLGQMMRAISEAQCGFIGSAVIGLSYAQDVREGEQGHEFWTGGVTAETVRPGTAAWERHRLHNAANLWHVQKAYGLTPDSSRLYKIAWTGGCVLYDREKLKAAGGFDFWRELPEMHAGEDVLAQLRVMARFGGAGIMPSGAYHQELPTTVPDRTHDAPQILGLTPEKSVSPA